LGREAATSNSEAKGDLDGDLYQDHPVADHFVASVVIDLMPCPVLNEFDGTKDGDEVKPAGKIKEIGNCKSGIDEDNPPSFKEHQLGRELSCKDPPDIVVQVHTIDFAEAYDQVQVVIVLTTLDDVYNHPDLIHRDKWHTAIERELWMTKWKSTPSLAGIAEDAADLFTMEIPSEWHCMFMKKLFGTRKEVKEKWKVWQYSQQEGC